MVQSSNLSSDLHPYYPVPPCGYRGGTLEALLRGDLDAVFIKVARWKMSWNVYLLELQCSRRFHNHGEGPY